MSGRGSNERDLPCHPNTAFRALEPQTPTQLWPAARTSKPRASGPRAAGPSALQRGVPRADDISAPPWTFARTLDVFAAKGCPLAVALGARCSPRSNRPGSASAPPFHASLLRLSEATASAKCSSPVNKYSEKKRKGVRNGAYLSPGMHAESIESCHADGEQVGFRTDQTSNMKDCGRNPPRSVSMCAYRAGAAGHGMQETLPARRQRQVGSRVDSTVTHQIRDALRRLCQAGRDETFGSRESEA